MKNIFVLFLLVFPLSGFAILPESQDVIQFGNEKSEKQHRFQSEFSKIEISGLNEPARRLLNPEKEGYIGGKMSFRMKVDSEKQNYFTVRFWGGEADKTMLMLFCDGKQVGYRHLGDIEFIWLGNGQEPLKGRYFYTTIPVPLAQTQGKSEVNLEIRAYGDIWPYGETFDKFQRNMEAPSRSIFKAYTHTSTCLEPEKSEIQGSSVQNPPVEKVTAENTIDDIKVIVNKELTKYINQEKPLGQLEMWFLADAYDVKWSVAYLNPKVLRKVTSSIDDYYQTYLANPKIIISDPKVYNYEWLAVGPVARAIRGLGPALRGKITPEQKANWTEMLIAGLQFGITHRRQYTNQSMIIDLFAYHTNRALQLLSPEKALPESQMMNYLYESVGLKPWLGIETPSGPAKPLGDNYWQLTAKGLTKELGFVGYYGEVLDWVNDIYKATAKDGVPNSGDEQIKNQLLKMAKARSYFRYPAVDSKGNRAMRIEAVVGWRDPAHYPGDVIYGDRGMAWDATPLMTAANTLDPTIIGYAQQMFEDNQFFNQVKDKIKIGTGIRNVKSLLFIPDEYELVKSQKSESTRLPMTKGAPDFVFADEEDGVVAVKNGDEILYASLYWRARVGVNHLAKVHYITPTMDRIANIYIESQFESSGMEVTRQNWPNFGFSPQRNWYTDIESVHTGEKLPVAKIPEGVKYKQGQENVYAGRAQFYLMRYGKYLVAMNSSKDKTFDVNLPENATDLTNSKMNVLKGIYELKPMTTVVYYIQN
jgi:hypothetical protein